MADEPEVPRECACVLCDDSDTDLVLDEAGSQVLAHVKELGWSVNCVIAGDQLWAYTVGLQHSFQLPELAIFGLDHETMGRGLNGLVEAARADHDLLSRVDEPVKDVFEDHPAVFKRVHPSWCRQMFGHMLGFYRTRPWLDVLQVAWPDSDGHWPWEDAAADACRQGQPHSWFPVRSHPDGPWRLLATGAEQSWPFWPDSRDAGAFTTRDIVDGFAEIAGVVHGRDGWQFLDSRPNPDARICMAELGELVRVHSWLAEFADLPVGWGAWRTEDGGWRRDELPEELQ